MAIKAPSKNSYELLIVIKSNLSDEDIEKNISQTESAIKSYGGAIVRIDEPVRKRFTHKMKGCKEGIFVSILFNSPPEAPNTLKKTLAIADDILRYILVKRESLK